MMRWSDFVLSFVIVVLVILLVFYTRVVVGAWA